MSAGDGSCASAKDGESVEAALTLVRRKYDFSSFWLVPLIVNRSQSITFCNQLNDLVTEWHIARRDSQDLPGLPSSSA